MTEQELRQALGEAIKSEGIPEGQAAFDLKQRILVAAKSYADAREKEKDAEIERLKHAVKLWESLRDDAIDANSQLQVHNQRILDYVKSIRSKIQHGTATLYEIATIVEAAIINQ